MGLCQGRNLWYFICVGPHRLPLSNGNSGTPWSVGVDELGCGSVNFRRLAQVVNSCVRPRHTVDRLPLPPCQPKGVPLQLLLMPPLPFSGAMLLLWAEAVETGHPEDRL